MGQGWLGDLGRVWFGVAAEMDNQTTLAERREIEYA